MWTTDIHTNTLLIYNEKPLSELNNDDNLAIFDLDGTVITTKSGNKFPRDENDWTWCYKNVHKKLTKLLKRGNKIVIVSNQNLNSEIKINAVKTKVENIVNTYDAKHKKQIIVFIATKKDIWRKPHYTIWDMYLGRCNKANCFFVGDAAGRDKDHSCVDRKFAYNIGIEFYTPEEYFEGSDTTKSTFHLDKIGKNTLKDVVDDWQLPKMKSPYIAILIGAPGSGKSSFAKQYLPNTSIVSLDVTKTKAKTFKLFKELLNSGINITIDNTNPTKEGRAQYTQLARQSNYHCYYFLIDTTKALSNHLNFYRESISWRSYIKSNDKSMLRTRVPDIVYRIYYSKLELPSKYTNVPALCGMKLSKREKRLFLQYSE